MTRLQDIRSAIQAKLAELANNTNSALQSAYDYSQPSTLDPTPATTLQFEQNNNDQATPTEISRQVVFNVRLYVRNNDGQQAEQTLLNIIDDIVAKFDSDPTLNNLVLRIVPTDITAGYESTEQNFRTAEIKLTIDLVNQC